MAEQPPRDLKSGNRFSDKVEREEESLDTLANLFARAGFETVDPPILQPVAPFLDYSGEDVRRRMYMTSDPTGREFCLRPDFTIPVALDHLKAGGGVARLSYLGPVFRHRPDSDEQSEFLQAGVEAYGGTDEAANDAEIIALAIEAAALAGVSNPIVRLGDVGLAAAFLDALDLPAIWRRRLWRQQGRPEGLDAFFSRMDDAPRTDTAAFPALAALLRAGETEDATRVVEDVLAMSGTETVGGRGPHEIASRFVEKAMLQARDGLADDKRRLLLDFEAINAPHAEALDAVEVLASSAGLDLSNALARCRARLAALADIEPSGATFHFDCGFNRPLDYYTGLVFDLHAPETPEGGKLIGGGRYDALMGLLGSPEPVSAVGFSLWVARLFPEGGS